MRTFAAILAILVCVGNFLPCECENGEDIKAIKILSSDGSYVPGSMLAWNVFYNSMKKHADPEGVKWIDLCQDEVIPIDKALAKGDMVGVAKILRKMMPYMKKLKPHMKDTVLQNIIQTTADRAEKLIPILEADGANLSDFGILIESTTTNLGNILQTLVKGVVKLVNSVMGDVLVTLG